MSISHIRIWLWYTMKLKKVLNVRVRVDLRVMAMKYSLFARCQELESHHQMQFKGNT